MQIVNGQIKSEAFQRAKLNSERFRIIGLLCLLGALLVWTVLRSLTVAHIRLLLAQLFLTAIAIVYQGLMLLAVRRALDKNRRIPSAISVLITFIEAQIPTL